MQMEGENALDSTAQFLHENVDDAQREMDQLIELAAETLNLPQKRRRPEGRPLWNR